MPAPALSFEAYSDGHPLRNSISVVDRFGKRTDILALVTTLTEINDEGKITSPLTECRTHIAYTPLVKDEAATIMIDNAAFKARDVQEAPQSESVSFYVEHV